jgi:lipocalin-like protein
MTTTTPDDLLVNMFGAWTLQSHEAHSIDESTVTYPLGVHAQGIITDTPDGYMSAQDPVRANGLTRTWR